MCCCRAETDAVLVNAGVTWQPFSDLALAELPQVASPEAWELSAEEAHGRRDLRSTDYFICSIDPPGQLSHQNRFGILLPHRISTLGWKRENWCHGYDTTRLWTRNPSPLEHLFAML